MSNFKDLQFLGRHILAEFWEGINFTDPNFIEKTLKEAALHAGANILGAFTHHFGDELGVTSVVILSESHISIHTWPEHNYAAIDIFMCGNANPVTAIKFLQSTLQPNEVKINEHLRGELATKLRK